MKIKVSNSNELYNAVEKINSTKDDIELIISEGCYEALTDIDIKRNNVKNKGDGNVTLKGSKKIDITSSPKDGKLVIIDLEKEGISDTGEFGLGPYEDFWHVYDIPKPHMCDLGPGLELFYEDKLHYNIKHNFPFLHLKHPY